MKISPNYNDNEWKKLELSPDSPDEKWQKATEILKDRIKGRFLDHISSIKEKPFAGFAVLALDCLLIETLQQFREGVDDTPNRQSMCYFVNFLTQTAFKEYFDIDKASKFYDQIRCGILHKAETKGNSIVRIDIDNLVEYTKDKRGLRLNRNLFHEKLEEVFESYIRELLNPNNQGLRINFMRKMNFICRQFPEVI